MRAQAHATRRGKTLRVLLVEDNPADARLIEAHLEEGGYALELLRVASQREFEEALGQAECRYELVLSDYRVPGFDGTEALAVAKRLCPELPFLFVSGALGEDRAIELLKRGATDYVLKDRLERLLPSVERALQESADRAERKRAEEGLAKSEALLRTVVSSLAEGVILQDASGTIQHANRSAERLLGHTVDSLVGTVPQADRFPSVIREDGSPVAMAEWPAYLALQTGVPQLGKVHGITRPDGTRVWLLFNAQPLFDPGKTTPVGVVTSFSDVTERRRRAEFEQQLIGIVSHDLRNPISAMMMSASALMKRGELEPHLVKGLARIVNSGERASRLIRDLLDFTQARLGSGIPIRREPVDLHVLAEAVVEEVRSTHPERDIRFERVGDASGEWDPGRVSQVCANLLTNAVAYSPADTSLLVRTSGEGETAVLEVHNLGEPIPESVLPVLFEPFRRGREHRHGSAGNIGLGLFIVHQLVRSHGGKIEVTSTAEDGTRFRVRLPK